MKYLITLLFMFPTELVAQTSLIFNKRFVECEDKWVAFQSDKDSTYAFGFIYIDSQAGLTLNYEGRFKIGNTGNLVLTKMIDSTSIKVRLQPNQVKVALIPETKFAELRITPIPNWLRFYKTDTTSIERLFRWGFLYNSWDECAKALTYLEKAQKLNPKHKGLEFELAYAYNCSLQFDKAIVVLKNAILTSPNECHLFKELSYAEMSTGKLSEASETCKKGISICTEKPMKAEIAYNMSFHYFKNGDKTNFKYWADETEKWATKGDQFTSMITKLKHEMAK